MERIFAIGDIHGCYDPLVRLLGRVPIDWTRDRLVFMGDYIDRGPQSFEVIEHLIELQKRHPETVFLKGNHEQMLADYLSGKDRMTYLYNGGQQTLDSYLRNSSAPGRYPIPEAHLRFFESLQLMFETENYIFVHAGLRKGLPLENQRPEDLLWIRENFVDTRHSFGKRVVFGHTPFDEPRVEPNKIGIDTGAVYGNKLTCVQLPEEEFFFA
ncbi:MAG: serine/threonine protein phosphatase [Desulfobacterales bacterium]|nr:serine/threonine protein phosphatase [Desulfobacterales bacterium]